MSGWPIMELKDWKIDLYDLSVKSYFAPRKADYVSPITHEAEPRTQAVMLGIKKQFNAGRAKEISDKEKKSLIQKLKDKIEILQTMLELLNSNQTITEFQGRKWGDEDFSYVKLRNMDEFYRLSHLVGRSGSCLFMSQIDDRRRAALTGLDKEMTTKEIEGVLINMKAAMESGYYSFGQEYSYKLRDGINIFEEL